MPQKSPVFPKEVLSTKPYVCGLLSTVVNAAFESHCHVLTCMSWVKSAVARLVVQRETYAGVVGLERRDALSELGVEAQDDGLLEGLGGGGLPEHLWEVCMRCVVGGVVYVLRENGRLEER